MKRVSSKKLMIGIVCILAGIAAATAVVFAVSGRGTGSTDPTKESNGETSVSAWKVDDSAAHAKALYKCAVSDIGDTASVVDLLETMKLESVSGKYTAEISGKDGQEVLTLTLSDEISKADQNVFNDNMKLCAQQMLALIPGVQAVEWTYPVRSDGAEAEQATVSLDEKGAGEGLAHDIRAYGKSAKAVQKLLQEQSGS